MFTRLKESHLFLFVVLLLPLFLSIGQKAEAYGVMNHENVVDVGKQHFVVLKEDGSVWSWGDHAYGQLGAYPSASSTNPIPIQKADGNRLLNIKAIAAGGYHTVALDVEGKVWTWGSNSYGQLGHSVSLMKNEKPTSVGSLPRIKAISAGDFHTLAVDESGQVWAWGRNIYGQLGQNNHAEYSATPLKVNGLSDIVAVAAGAEHSVALKRDGTVWTWGRNASGQLGNGETTEVNFSPKSVPGLTNVMEIAAGNNHTLALKQDRTTIWAWGSNAYGQLGDGGRESKLRPVEVQGIRNVTTIAAGDNHTIAIKEDGTVWTWGRNTSGTETSRTTPIQVKGLTNSIAIGGGGYYDSYILAIKQDGTVWMWDKASSDPTTKEPIFKKVPGIDGVMQNSEFPFVQGGQVLFRYIGNFNTSSVQVNGSFNNGIDLPLKHIGNNIWELQIELQPGEYDYGFKVNGQWTPDPLNRHKKFDNFGNPLSVVKVAPYATVGPIIDGNEVTFTYSSYDYNNTLELNAKTSYVAVIGSFSNWVEIPLEKQANNTWMLTRTLDPGDYYYSFIVRDAFVAPLTEKRNDPLNPNLETNSNTGISRNTFHVSEKLVNKVPVQSVTISGDSTIDLVVGEQKTLYAQINPTNATNKNINWNSSNPSIVSVDDKGNLTAHSKGTAVIVVTTVDGGKAATVTITVDQQDDAVSYPRVGYKDFGVRTGVSPTKAWNIVFSKEIDRLSVNEGNVYALNESGGKVPLGYQVLSDGKNLEIRLLNGYQYERGATYYLFIEDSVKTFDGQKLKEPIQMKFQIEL